MQLEAAAQEDRAEFREHRAKVLTAPAVAMRVLEMVEEQPQLNGRAH